jgi:hypothetical protein
MDKITGTWLERIRTRLIAAALELQHYASTAANMLPIPDDRGIMAGTSA